MIQGKWFAPGEDLSAEVLPVRYAIFGTAGDPVDSAGWNTIVYLDGYRENLKAMLDGIIVQEKDGTRHPLKKKEPPQIQ